MIHRGTPFVRWRSPSVMSEKRAGNSPDGSRIGKWPPGWARAVGGLAARCGRRLGPHYGEWITLEARLDVFQRAEEQAEQFRLRGHTELVVDPLRMVACGLR